MGFIKKINQRKFTLISILMFFYIILNLIDGERGLISFYEKQKIKTELTERKKSLNIQLASIEEIANVNGVGKETALVIWKYFHP